MRFNYIRNAVLSVCVLLALTLISCKTNPSPSGSGTMNTSEHSLSEKTASTESVSTTETSTGSAADSGKETTSGSAEEKRVFVEDYELEKTDGTKVKLSSLAKENTLLVFWATWCPYCVREIPVLEELEKEYDNLSIVMVNTGEAKDTVVAFEAANNMTLQSVYDEKSKIAGHFGITGFPSTVFLTEELEFIGSTSGKMEKDEFEAIFQKIKEFRTKRGDFN